MNGTTTNSNRGAFVSIVLFVVTSVAALSTSACASVPTRLPKTLGERNSGYTYVPLDPLPVVSVPDVDRGCSADAPISKMEALLEALPDQAVRVAVGRFDESGTLTFGPVQTGVSGSTYQVTLDYINVDASNVYFDVWYMDGDGVRHPLLSGNLLPDTRISARRVEPTDSSYWGADRFVIPVYVGLGLRLTATVSVVRGRVNLSSLGSIAAEAQAGRVTGTLVVQTLGITGPQVTTSLPLPSELNATTVQNAILSLGSIKAVLYDEDAIKTPRVTGIYNSIGIGGQRLVNAIVSELAAKPISWKRPCIGSENRGVRGGG